MNPEVLIDARWLPPPEPMEQVLMALDLLRPGQRVRLLLHREPYPLYVLLDDRGYRHSARPIEDGCFEILIAARMAPS